MTSTSEPEKQSAAAAVVSEAKPGKLTLSPLSPNEREKVAKWIENKYHKLPGLIVQAEDLLRRRLGPPSLQGQVDFWRAQLATAKQLAYLARTERGGPLAGV